MTTRHPIDETDIINRTLEVQTFTHRTNGPYLMIVHEYDRDPDGEEDHDSSGIDEIAELVMDYQDGQPELHAARLVACWNACEGIDDPADLRRQRDELLAALEMALRHIHKDAMEYDKGTHGERVYVTDAIRKLIAKATT